MEIVFLLKYIIKFYRPPPRPACISTGRKVGASLPVDCHDDGDDFVIIVDGNDDDHVDGLCYQL